MCQACQRPMTGGVINGNGGMFDPSPLDAAPNTYAYQQPSYSFIDGEGQLHVFYNLEEYNKALDAAEKARWKRNHTCRTGGNAIFAKARVAYYSKMYPDFKSAEGCNVFCQLNNLMSHHAEIQSNKKEEKRYEVQKDRRQANLKADSRRRLFARTKTIDQQAYSAADTGKDFSYFKLS